MWIKIFNLNLQKGINAHHILRHTSCNALYNTLFEFSTCKWPFETFMLIDIEACILEIRSVYLRFMSYTAFLARCILVLTSFFILFYFFLRTIDFSVLCFSECLLLHFSVDCEKDSYIFWFVLVLVKLNAFLMSTFAFFFLENISLYFILRCFIFFLSSLIVKKVLKN